MAAVAYLSEKTERRGVKSESVNILGFNGRIFKSPVIFSDFNALGGMLSPVNFLFVDSIHIANLNVVAYDFKGIINFKWMN